MKLTELRPEWRAASERFGQLLVFDCPCCRGKEKAQRARIAVALLHPLDGGSAWLVGGSPVRLWKALGYPNAELETVIPPGFLWGHAGDSFEELSLSPSVDASPAGHWHGWVKNGEVRS